MAETTLETPPFSDPQLAAQPTALDKGKWLVLAAAFLGWMFDGLEMGIFPQVARPSLNALMHGATEADIGRWHQYIDALFLIGAACGGLVFGWLGDKIGRVRSMSLSILVYSLFTGLCYFAQAPWHIGALRFISAIGMGGEWSLGVALVMEVWPSRHRPLLAGLIGAASNVGFLLISFVCYIFPVTTSNWRYIMLCGALPALLTFVFRMFVPESERWQESQRQQPSRPVSEIFGSGLAKTTLLAILFASIALMGTWASVQKIPAWTGKMPGGSPPMTGMLLAVGAIAGCLLAPLLAARFNRRIAYFGLCLGSLVVCQLLFRLFDQYTAGFMVMVFLAGAVTAAFYGWLPLYLPELFPTRVRATAQGIAFNFGRIFAAAGAIYGGQLMEVWGSYPRMCAALSLVYVLGMVLIWFAPETKGKPLPE